MLRIILSLCFFTLFVFADSCDFSNSKQKDCELDINNPPILLHKFIDENDNVSLEYGACIYDGKIQIYDEEYDVINCSMVENNKGFLTEGVIFENTIDSNNDINYKLTTNKNIELKNDNILLRVAGDFVLDSGIRINTQQPKNLIIEIVEGTNGKSNIILQRGAKLGAEGIIMPDGENSTITLNTFFGGIYEEDFINTINETEQDKRGNMETIINVDNIFSLSQDGEAINPYNGNVVCGPEVNPLDLSNNQYILKRLYSVKNDSKDSPNDENSICEVKEGKCFDGILAYNDIDIQNKDYKIATAKLDIIPSYGVFIESGKIYLQDGSQANLNDMLPNANILSQNDGQCGIPNKVAFSQEVIDLYNTTMIAEATPQEKQESNDINIEEPQEELSDSFIDDEPLVEYKDNIANQDEINVAKIDINDDFLIIEKENFDNFNKICNGDLQCLSNQLLPFDKLIWNKLSSNSKVNSIYILNLTNDKLDVICNITDYYGENLEISNNLDSNNILGTIDLKFPQSSNETQITCKSTNTTKQTNKINVTPAKFVLNPIFEDSDSLKAGVINIIFENSKALNLEGEIDSGFNGNLIADSNSLEFKQNNMCSSPNKEVFIQKPMTISFENGEMIDNKAEFIANTITKGKLNINFNIENNTDFCSNDNPNMPKCINANISKDINVIPANFMIKTDIISPYKISYYGQIDDRNTFKFNPILDITLNALNNKDEIIDINQSCNYGSIQLGLDSNLLVEFKRSVSDRLNSKVNIYLDEFDDKQTANLSVYFGITKVADKYNNLRKIKQNDLVEPQEIKLTDLSFNAKYKTGNKFYDYNDLIVYDRLTDDSKPISVIIARGKMQVDNTINDSGEENAVIIKYEIYCETCDTNILAKYLEVNNMEMDSPNWYINTKHPSDFYLSDKFIKTNLNIQNSNKAFEGMQKIIFTNNVAGNYNVTIDQTYSGFAPYLNYNKDFKNIYLGNSFDVSIKINQIMQNIKPEIKEEETIEPPKVEIKEKKQVVSKKPEVKSPKPKAKSPNQIQLDIED
ncbi:hypothetical protein CCY99_01310 [Helicobacter sp. 16-1353]|uniref:hypothetical protein n=1 Tax=Helicobacter sp. 16-1353 TaxID=2004996 RepID=UPI000DCDA015|nr:hypothetical protein [Helicobacter sp. 16-1353]RAX55363.1 hypothetical protein CCY99_01310 [Helicobacter sp. 16-1353]